MWLWAAFIIFILFLLVLDLGVFHRKAHVITLKEALTWSGVWKAWRLSSMCSSISPMSTTGLDWTFRKTSRTEEPRRFYFSLGISLKNRSAWITFLSLR